MKSILFIVFVVFNSTLLFGGDYVVIVNPANSTADITSANLKRIYTGKITDLNGVKVVPINQTLEEKTATDFLNEIVGKTPADYKEFWVNQQVKGLGSAPMVQKSSEAVIAMVSQIPGAIGYVEKDKVTDEVKAIAVK